MSGLDGEEVMGEEIIKPRTGKLSVMKIAPSSYVEPGRPKYPSDFSPRRKRTFKRICKQLEARRTLTEGDFDLIVLFAIQDDRRATAQEHIDAEGEMVTTKKGQLVPSPWLAVAEKAEARMLSILDRLGLSPAAGDRVKVCRRVAEPDLLEITLNPEPPKEGDK
jgi:P27 family predicted phage terminase small subunit